MSEIPSQEWKLKVHSESTDAIYVVEVFRRSKRIQFACSCQAGTLKKLCKHVLAVINEDSSSLIQSNQTVELNAIREAFRCSEVNSALTEYQMAENEKAALEKRLKELKKTLSKTLLG